MGFVSDVVDSITGKGGEKAARETRQAQEESIDKAIAFEEEQREIARADLQPFREAGEGQINRLVDLIEAPREEVDISDVFDPASEVLTDDIAGRAAARGKLGSGGTLSDIFRENALLGESLRTDRLRLNEGFRQNDVGNALNLTNLGQASAAGQANITQGTANSVSNLTTSRGDVAGAGIMGAQNARNAGTSNLISLASMFI